MRRSSLAEGWGRLKVWAWPCVMSCREKTRRDPREDPTHSSPQGVTARAVIAPTLNACVGLRMGMCGGEGVLAG